MVLKLSPETEKRIEALVASGDFRDAEEVLDVALLSLERDSPEYWDKLEALSAEADADVANGRMTRADDALIDSLRERVRAQTQAKRA
jgi:Arc/MetJ-type ribon-helix-helix transcriptional regulator